MGRREQRSRPGAVAEEHHAVAEAAFVQQRQAQTSVSREGRIATPHDAGRYEQVQLVDQSLPERMRGEIGAGPRFQLLDPTLCGSTREVGAAVPLPLLTISLPRGSDGARYRFLHLRRQRSRRSFN